MYGGVQPTVACKAAARLLSAKHWEGTDCTQTAAHDQRRCSSHDSLTRWPSSPSATDTSASPTGKLETVDSDSAPLRLPTFLWRCFRTPREHRTAAGLQQVAASADRARDRTPFSWRAPWLSESKFGAMESDEQAPYSCGAEEKSYDLGHLPPLLEDEVSGGRFEETGWEGKTACHRLDAIIK